MRNHSAVIEGARQAAVDYGAGSGASPLISGFLPCHQELIDRLLEWTGATSGMLFNSGFLANQAILKNLPGRKDIIFADHKAHHSIAHSLPESKAKFRRYRHLDLDHLEALLEKKFQKYETVFVVTESVFSMDGVYPDLKRLVELKKQWPFVWILDEAHGTGVYGPTGAGLAEETGTLKHVDVLVGTLGKALGSMGAYVLTRSEAVIDYLINKAGEFIYSTFLSPAQAGAATAAIPLIQQAKEERAALRKLSLLLRSQLAETGWQTIASDSPIIPIIIEDPGETLRLKDFILENGIVVGAARPPTVPQGSSRLRISLHSGVREQHLSKLLDILDLWKRR